MTPLSPILSLMLLPAAPAQPPLPSKPPLLRAVDLKIGETQTIELSNRKKVAVKLLDLVEVKDDIRDAVRSARVKVEVDGQAVTLFSGNYHLPQTIAGVHIEDQLFPKRAHYHKYQVHAAPVEEFALKIRYACRERDRTDPDFVVIARTDTCREHGLEEAVPRLNRAAEEGADMGLLFPRDRAETERAPRACRLPLVYVMSRGHRDGRPVFTIPELKAMGWAAWK